MPREIPTLPKSAPRPGEFVSGAYRVEQALGAGGMGYVLAVTRLSDKASLAIKMLNPDLAEDPRIVARFLHEARAAQSVTSEHVCRVFDVGTLPTGTPYLVMERLRGTDLATWIEREGPVPFVQAVDWILEACEALAEAHAQRYVHRDLKPSNLFLATVGGRSIIKVLDFGIAKSLDMPQHSKLTTTSAVLGSPSYMSPEQLKSSKDIDVHSDIWSLGVVLYELLSGQVPFDAPTLPELSVLILTGKPTPLTMIDATIPRELSNLVGACLRRDPSQRFGNLAELASHLAPLGTPLGRESADRVIAQLGMPATRIVIGSEEELATTMQASKPRMVVSEDLGSAVTMPDESIRGGVRKTSRTALAVGIVTALTVAAGAFAFRTFNDRTTDSATTGITAASDARDAAAATSIPTMSTFDPPATPDPAMFQDASASPTSLHVGGSFVPPEGVAASPDAATAKPASSSSAKPRKPPHGSGSSNGGLWNSPN